MAEEEAAMDIIDDVDDEMADEADEADEEADEEVKEKIEQAKEEVGKLKSALNSLKEIEWGQVVKDFVKFVIKNAAVGAIMWAVMIALNKIISKSSGTEKTTNQKKQKKIQALAQLISDVSTYIKDLTDWMQAKKDVTVDAGSGIMVPLPDVFTKYTKPMQTHIDTIYNVAKELWPDSGSGNKTAAVPTIDQVNQIVTNTGPVVDGLQDIVTFTNTNKEKFPDLSTMPIKQYNVDQLNGDLETVKALPYA